MRKFRERNLMIVAGISAVILLIAGFLAINIGAFTSTTYSVDLASAVGLQAGNVVTIAGVRVGAVSGLSLGKGVAHVTFTISGGHHLGQDTAVEIKILNPVGVEYLELVPAGPGTLHGTIPVSRTTLPGTLVSDLNDLTTNEQQTNIPQLVQALKVLTQTVAANSPTETKAALDGVAQLSAVLAGKQQELETLVSQANSLTSLLQKNNGQLVDLIGQSSLLLQTLNDRRAALQQLLTTTSQLTDQLDHIIVGDRSVLDPMLADLATVTQYLASDSNNISQAIPLVAAFSRYSANVAGSGPFADFVAPTLVVPDNLIAQCAKIGQLDPQRGCRP